jgi:hypothetical protein
MCFLPSIAKAATWPAGDLSGDLKVDVNDLKLFAEQWLDPSGCSGFGCADLNGVNGVNFSDFSILANHWQQDFNGRLFINEVMASNHATIEDPEEPGSYPDWLEIYNASDKRIELGGLYLTDKPDTNPTKWQIPDGVGVDANSYIVFWADEDTEQGNRHTNFKISANGESIGLFASDGQTVIDRVDFGPQESDISYGRYPDASDSWQFMGIPTPGYRNNAGYLGNVADIKFSVERGIYDSPFQVRLATDTEGAVIRYTTDGKDPVDSNGTVYNASSPIQITKTTCLRAAASKVGWMPSSSITQTYIFLINAINQPATRPDANWPLPGQSTATNNQRIDYEMDPDITTSVEYSGQMRDSLLAIPSISLVTDLKNLFDTTAGLYVNCGWYGEPGWIRGDAWKRPASVELINPDGSRGFQINTGFSMRGVTSCQDGNPKHAFRLFLESEYGGGALNFPLFGDEGASSFSRVDLRCEENWSWSMDGSPYNTAVREVFCRDLQREMGEPYTRSRYYHLYVNGLYWGLYETQERPESNYGSTYFGGTNDDYDTVKPNRSWPRSMECVDGTFDAYKRLWQACLDGFETDIKYYKVQGQNTDGTVNPSYERLVDVNNLIDYMITIFYTGDYDAPISGWYGNEIPNNFFGIYNHTNPDGFKFFRHDGEHAMMGEYYGADLDRTGPFTASTLMNFIEGCPVEPWASQICIGFNPQTIHQYLVVHPEYILKFADHVHKFLFNNGPMTIAGAQNLFAARAAQIDSAIIAESARWGDAQTSPALTKDTWLNTIDYVLNTYITGRTATVLTQLQNRGWYPTVAAPIFKINGSEQYGGMVAPSASLTMTATSGDIYYTLDGSDPRTPLTGAIHGTKYTSAITLTNPVLVKARAYSGGTWSALSEAVYNITTNTVQSSLRITEIMYHPQESPPVDPDTEFIELKNIGSSAINLRWAQFTEGIHFVFPNTSLAAGGYIVVVKDLTKFTAKYGGGINVAGVYSGTLSNAGDRIKLEDAIGNTILDFEYKDTWAGGIADGEGYSLTINNENNSDKTSWGREGSWSAGTNIGGSPGAADSGPRWGDVVINEVLAHQDSYPEDWIELHNTTGSPIDITGFFLSDNDLNLTKYQIPSTTIPANGYVVFTEAGNFGAYFALSENGETVYLTGKKDGGGILTGYRQVQKFGASEKDISFGRYLKSTGNYDFVSMSSQTSSAANAYPKVGPVIISEIMYRPEKLWGNWDAEYIELYNTTASRVNLYDANSCWKFTDGIEYTFPSDANIPAHGYLLVVKNLTAFNAQYTGVPAGVRKLQWTSGGLDNDGENIEISMPGDIGKYISIDRVSYSNGSHPENFDGATDPWSVWANGLGYSLTKVNYSLYGNDPNAWAAYLPSPGQAGTAPTLPLKATSPNPASGDINRIDPLTLSWSNGGGATSYDVYFGTDSTPDETEYKTNTTTATYNTGSLDAATTYYWRIDARNLLGTTTGDVWNFTTKSWTVLTSDNFESGWGNYTSGGGNAKIYKYTVSPNYAHEGIQAADIVANSGDASSFWHTSGIDVSTPNYTQIKVDFWYKAIGMEAGKSFRLMYYDGSTWQTIKQFVSGTDFANGQFYHSTLLITEGTEAGQYNFPTNAKIKFRCEASDTTDNIYIDEISVTAR